MRSVLYWLDQHAELDFYSANSLKQQSEGRHVALLGHIILIQSCVLSGEATNTNCIVFGLTRTGLEPTLYRTLGEHANHYATDEPTLYRTLGEHANHYATDEPTLYRTLGEHANHYATDAVNMILV